jgi:hypothetical protein
MQTARETKAGRSSGAEVVSIAAKRRASKVTPEFTRELLALIERIHEADAAQEYPVPPQLLQHGAVGLSVAAKLLGCTPESLRANSDVGRTKEKDGSELFPLSELLREYRRGRRRAVKNLISDAEQLIRSTTSIRSRFYNPIADHLSERHYVTAEAVAERLGISRAAAGRMMKDDDGPLFGSKDGRGSIWITEEELEAYARSRETGKSVHQ